MGFWMLLPPRVEPPAQRLMCQPRLVRRDIGLLPDRGRVGAPSKRTIDFEREPEVVKDLGAPAMQYQRPRTIILDDFRDMGGQDQRPIGALVEKLLMASDLKIVIPGGDNFVDQVTIEIDSERGQNLAARPFRWNRS